MGWWIDNEGDVTVTDPETGETIIDDGTVQDFTASMLRRHEEGESVKQLAASTALDEYLIYVALDMARADRATDRCTS